MVTGASPSRRRSVRTVTTHAAASARFAGRYLTAGLRAEPDFVILGVQRGGTTSLYRWLISHPDVDPALKKEIHYFDEYYGHGRRWYRAHFPIRHRNRITGEASPYMLFHPLAPERAARDLPSSTKFIVILREPTQRAISHYWFRRQWFRRELEGTEIESLERAIELEPERMAAAQAPLLRGERSFDHVWLSYLSRGEYATQLRRWFDAVGRERILIVESEKLPTDPAESEGVLEWLGLRSNSEPYPLLNGARRLEEADPELVNRISRYYEPRNRDLFTLLGRELWTESLPAAPPGEGTSVS